MSGTSIIAQIFTSLTLYIELSSLSVGVCHKYGEPRCFSFFLIGKTIVHEIKTNI